MDAALQASLENLGHQLADSRDQTDAVWEAARQAALNAHAAGVPETAISEALGINRHTIRRWRGVL